MARRPLATSRPLIAFLFGLAGALAAVVFHLADLDRRGELYALDLRFKHASSAAGPENILHVDIDDRSLAEIGRWPWPRQTQADIVSILNECGARAIALDIIMPEPQKVRYVSEAHTLRGATQSELLSDAPPVPVWDDLALMQTIRECGNVMLPIHVDFSKEDICEGIITTRVAEMLTRAPEAPFEQILMQILPDLPPHRITREREIVERTFLRVNAMRAIGQFTADAKRIAAGARIDDALLTPPLAPLARWVKGSGFVTFVPDVDKAMRRIPLLARSDGKIYLQFALATAVGELARLHGGSCTIDADADTVTLRCKDRTVRAIPVDSDGRMLIHWARSTWPPQAGVSGHSRISAASVASLSKARHQRKRLDDQAQAWRLKLISLCVKVPNDRLDSLYWKLPELRKALDQAFLNRCSAEREVLAAAMYDPARNTGRAKLDTCVRTESQCQRAFVQAAEQFVAGLREGSTLDVSLGKPSGPDPTDAKAKAQRANAQANFEAARAEAMRILALLDKLPDQRQELDSDIARIKAELVPIIKGKICMVGSTSTGAADFVPCPLGARTPGVVVHSNIIDTILDGRFIYEAHWSVNLLAILLAGAAAAAAAALRPVVQAAGIAVVIAGAYVLFNAYVVFGLWSVWLVAVAPLVAVLASFLVVTAYRQLTEERGKRQLKAMLVQTLSPEVVEEVLKDPALLDPGGQTSALTCLFSDLAGFTPLSEQLGPQETVRLLNRYFDGATDAIAARWGGWVNKFLGDGVFAIFGVPVRPERHAMRAVQAAIDCQQAVDQLNVELAREAGVTAQLSVRIGITTGEAMVGNCGSTTKTDLTAIGNTVNQASRLEAANKSFNTRIIVASETWEACDRQTLLARPLGRVFIVGVSEAVRVWHVLGRVETLGDELRPALDDFARAVDLFAEQDFAGALALLEAVSLAMPDDKATAYYMHLCRQCAARPADDEAWRPDHNTKGVARIALPWQDVNPNEHTK